MFQLDYDITKSNFRARNLHLPEEDFEDRYHDTWERYLRYGVPEGINHLTAFARMWQTWYSATAERRREGTAEAIIDYYDPEDVAYTHAAHYDWDEEDGLIGRLFKRIKNQLTPTMQAVYHLNNAGYTLQEIADELRRSIQQAELFKNHITILLAREAGMSRESSRLEKKRERERERQKELYWKSK